jgi:flagellar hook-length control protein FliK
VGGVQAGSATLPHHHTKPHTSADDTVHAPMALMHLPGALHAPSHPTIEITSHQVFQNFITVFLITLPTRSPPPLSAATPVQVLNITLKLNPRELGKLKISVLILDN